MTPTRDDNQASTDNWATTYFSFHIPSSITPLEPHTWPTKQMVTKLGACFAHDSLHHCCILGVSPLKPCPGTTRMSRSDAYTCHNQGQMHGGAARL